MEECYFLKKYQALSPLYYYSKKIRNDPYG
jgi:hypothetical protein